MDGPILPRRRLFARLDRADAPCLWISGPPGSGKTTLVRSWLAARRCPGVWYAMTDEDGDVARFFHRIAGAARAALPGRPPPLPGFGPEHLAAVDAFAARFFSTLASALPRGAALVLDGCPELPAVSALQGAVRAAVAAAGPAGRLLVTSRTPPPPGLAGLVATGAVRTLGWDDLRLDEAESLAIARRRAGRGDPAAELRPLHAQSGGWVAGLVLLLEYRRLTPGAAHAPARAPGREEIFSYLAGELLDRTDDATRGFLTRAALLPQMTAAMAGALTGNPRAGAILDAWCRRATFTEATADGGYRFHLLFREMLLSRLPALAPREELRALRRRAAALLEESGQLEEAARHLLDGGDEEAYGQLLVRAAPALLAEGRHLTLREWLERIPPHARAASPWLTFWEGMARLPFELRESRRLLERAHALFEAAGDRAGLLLSWSGVVDTHLHGWSDFSQLDPWIERLGLLLAGGAGYPGPEVEARVAFSMFNALLFRQPQGPRLRAWAERAWSLARETADRDLAIAIHSHLLHHFVWAGDQTRAGVVAERLRALARAPGVSTLARARSRAFEAVHHWSRAAHAACRAAVQDGLALSQACGSPHWLFLLRAMECFDALSAGDAPRARRCLGELAAVLHPSRRLDEGNYHYMSGWAALLEGDAVRAAAEVRASMAITETLGTPIPLLFDHLALGQSLLEAGELAEAAAELAEARRINAGVESPILSHAIGLVEAAHAFRRGAEDAGLAALREAMALGRERGYVNFAFWQPSLVTDLCRRALAAGVEPAWVKELVRRRGLVPEEPPLDVPDWPWPVRVYVLDRFSVVRDGKACAPAGRPGQLLRALIGLGGREVAEEQLHDALWPDTDGDRAHQAFATNLHRLRRLLGSDRALVLRDGRLTLDHRSCWVDAWALDRALGQAESAWAKAEDGAPSPHALRCADRALGLVRGPIFGAWSGDRWIAPLRARLRSRYVRCVERLGTHLEAAGSAEEALTCWRRGLEVDGLAEELCRRHMACLDRLGRGPEALAAYRRFSELVQGVLGTSPSAATQALAERLRAASAPGPRRRP